MAREVSKISIATIVIGYFFWAAAGFGFGRLYPNYNTPDSLKRDDQMFSYGITVAAKASGRMALACQFLADDAENFPNEVKELQDNPIVHKYIDPIRKECNAASEIGMPYDVTPDPRTRGDAVLPGNVAPPEEGNCLVYDPKDGEPKFQPCPPSGDPLPKHYKAGGSDSPREQTQ